MNETPMAPMRAAVTEEVMPHIGGLRGQAELVLMRRLKIDPDNAKALLQVGEICRAKGDLAAALRAYRRASAISGPGRQKAAWLQALLGGDRLPHRPRGIWPAPFVRVMNFLAPAEQRRVLAMAMAMRDKFSPAKTGGSVVARTVRTAFRVGLAIDNLASDELDALFLPKIRRFLPDVRRRLRLDGYEPHRIHFDMTAYPNGGFGKPHQDAPPAEYRRLGVICVYYFHPQPKAFSGGDLLLYDTEVKERSYNSLSFWRLEPMANSAIFYLDAYWHAITPVKCDSDEFAHARFALTFRTGRGTPASH